MQIFQQAQYQIKIKNIDTTSDLLGIKLSINLKEISELNYTPKLLEINKIMKQ